MKYLLIAMGSLKYSEMEFIRKVSYNSFFFRAIEESLK